MSAPASGRHTLDCKEQGVDGNISDYNCQEAFLGSTPVTSMGTLERKFLVDENIVPIMIEKIPSIYTLFNLFFII